MCINIYMYVYLRMCICMSSQVLTTSEMPTEARAESWDSVEVSHRDGRKPSQELSPLPPRVWSRNRNQGGVQNPGILIGYMCVPAGILTTQLNACSCQDFSILEDGLGLGEDKETVYNEGDRTNLGPETEVNIVCEGGTVSYRQTWPGIQVLQASTKKSS